MKRTALFAFLALLLAACQPSGGQASLPTPIPPEALGTLIAATSGAAATQTAAVQPQATPTVLAPGQAPPTVTPSPTPSPTAAFFIVIATPTPYLTPLPPPPSYGGSSTGSSGSSSTGSTSSGGSTSYATPVPTAIGIGFCELLAASPSGEAAIRPGGDFDAVWELKNISDRPWDHTSIDLVYLEGERMQKFGEDVFDLPEYVKPGESTTLRVDMRAPFVAGTYTAIWGLQEGHEIRCKFSVTVKADGTPYPTFTPTPTPTATP